MYEVLLPNDNADKAPEREPQLPDGLLAGRLLQLAALHQAPPAAAGHHPHAGELQTNPIELLELWMFGQKLERGKRNLLQ